MTLPIKFLRIAHYHTKFFYASQSRRTITLQSAKHKNDKDAIINFRNIEKKTKDTYLEMLKLYSEATTVHRRGHVEFIYSALKHMEEFGVQKDLKVYKALIDVMPKGKLIPQNLIQAEFMHYPRQQQCIIDLLEQMEDNAVMPDKEMESMLLNIFGKRGYPLRKYWRMMYWMPKFRHLSPWPVPNPPPEDSFELAKLAIQRITSVDVQAAIDIYQTSELKTFIDDTWIVSSQCPGQQKLLEEHNIDEPIYIEGPFKVWLRNKTVDYFVLKAKAKVNIENEVDLDDVSDIDVPLFGFPKKKSVVTVRSMHEQDDGIILSVCATGSSSKDSLLSWIRHLEKDGNPKLAKVPIVFTLKSSGVNVDKCVLKPEAIEDKPPGLHS